MCSNCLLVLQVLSDVLPVCKLGLCCADSSEDPQLAAPIQILSLVSACWIPGASPLIIVPTGEAMRPFLEDV